MTLTNPGPSRKWLSRTLRFEHMEGRLLMAADLAMEQPAINVSEHDQLMLELINRARENPLAEAQRLGIDLNQGLSTGSISSSPKQPLAPNQFLSNAALAHSVDMLTNDYFSHTGRDGSSPSARAKQAGYPAGVAENIALYPVFGSDVAAVVSSSHDLLFRSAGHRQNLMSESMRDAGVGVALGERKFDNGNEYLTALSTQNFGRTNSSQRALTGVAFTDAVIDDDFYSLGEGMGNVLIEAVNSTGQRYSTRTGTHGGYVLQVPPGQYVLRAYDSARNSVASLGSVSIAESNVKLDLAPGQFVALEAAEPNTPGPETSNPVANVDVNQDGVVTPLDALMVINHLNDRNYSYQTAVDVNRDSAVSPVDALLVINHLNTRTNSITVSEPGGQSAPPTANTRLQQLITQAEMDMRSRFTGDWDLTVEVAKAVTWRDAGLELRANPTSKVATSGYQIVIRYATLLIEYRAAETGSLVFAGWDQISDYLTDPDGFCCPWAIDAPCLDALDLAIQAITEDFVHSAK